MALENLVSDLARQRLSRVQSVHGAKLDECCSLLARLGIEQGQFEMCVPVAWVSLERA